MGLGMDAGIGVLLLILNAFFVAAEYALVSTRRTRIEALVKAGSRNAAHLAHANERLSSFIAACQVGVTLCSLAIGVTVESLISRGIENALGTMVPDWLRFSIALLLATFATVIFGELIPKYLTLRAPERTALSIIQPLRFFHALFSPIASLASLVSRWVLLPFGIDIRAAREDFTSREELLLLVREGGTEGQLEAAHANVITKAFRFDKLDAEDIMVHRLDIRWLDINATQEQTLEVLSNFPHSRIPVCNGDIDEVVGILYIRDVLRALTADEWSLEPYLRPAELVPSNLNLTKIVERMRESRTQILMVVDEYGGTEGLITLEDVVEEVLGDLEDQPEADRPQFERPEKNRVSAKADARFDELLEFLGDPTSDDAPTETLAEVIVNQLERMPKLGDTVETELGRLQVENMAQRRITRVRVLLSSDYINRLEATS